jgi:hypothetical protein
VIDREPHMRAAGLLDAGAGSGGHRLGRRRWSARAQRELAGTLHLVRLERLADRLRSGPLSARVVSRRRGASVLTFRLGEDELDLVWWSFWSRPLDVSELREVSWRNDVGWKALFAPTPSTPLDAPGVAITDDGDHVVRLFAHRAEVHPVG